jgi:NAD(P)-dependent dehydrogenase (short-subunit alcohol dehydrogenase family)
MGAASSTALGKHSTAADVVAQFDAKLQGKTALVTGAASGIGIETVKALTSAGCRVLATAREVAAGERVIAAELAGGPTAATAYAGRMELVKVLPLELESLASVRALAAAVEAEAPGGLDFVVLNAGIMALPTLQRTAAGFEKQLGVNHFGHHLLVSLLRPRIVARTSAPARIVYVSSLAHSRGSVDVVRGGCGSCCAPPFPLPLRPCLTCPLAATRAFMRSNRRTSTLQKAGCTATGGRMASPRRPTCWRRGSWPTSCAQRRPTSPLPASTPALFKQTWRAT